MPLTPLLKARHYARRDVPCGRTRGGVIACDSFQRADGTTLGDTNMLPFLPGRPGFAWTEHNGEWEINASRIGSVGSSPGGQGWLCSFDCGIADAIYFEYQIAYTTDANGNGIVLRYTDTSNYIRLHHTSSVLAFVSVVAGTTTGIGSAATGVSPTAGDIVSGHVLGNAFRGRIIRAGVQVGTDAIVSSNSSLAGSSRVGFRAATASARFTNLVLRRAV